MHIFNINRFALFLFTASFIFSVEGIAQDNFSTSKEYVKFLDSVYRQNPNEALSKLENYLNIYEQKETQTIQDLDDIYYGLAKYSARSYSYNKTKIYAKKGIDLLDKNNMSKGKSGYFNILGNVSYYESKTDSAAYYFIQSLKNLKLNNEVEKIPYISNNIASIYYEKEDFNQALKYFKEAYISIEDKNPTLKGVLAGNISEIYLKKDSLKKANIYANVALKLGEETNQIKPMMIAYNTKANLATRNLKKDSAQIYLKKAYTIAETLKDTFQIQFIADNLASIMYKTNPKEAIKYGEIAYKINNKEAKNSGLYQNTRNLALAYYYNEDFKKSAEFYTRYTTYQDSLIKENYTKNTIDILEKYKAAEKELTIAQQEAKITKEENNKRLLIITLIGVFLIALIVFLFFKQKQKTQQQKIIGLENEKENIALRSIMSGEEKERSRIAKELHDGLGGVLAAAKMHASNTGNSDKLLNLLDTASKETRRISHNLLPESLTKKGLDAALKDYINSINENSLLKVDYISLGLKNDLPQSLQLSVYRIIQELINNIIKHSSATDALVQLQQEPNKLIITVEDNGKGFKKEHNFNGIGLQNIESRLSLLKGTLEINSKQAQGTSVYIVLTLEK